MRKTAYQWLDRRAIEMGYESVRRAGQWPARLEEARALLELKPFFPDPIVPANIGLREDGHFEFPSNLQTPWVGNDRVRGWLRRAGGDWRRKPCVILLHGLQGEIEYRWKYPWFARHLAGQDISTLAMVLPFHGARRPRGPGEVGCFLSSNLTATVNAFRQAVTDVRVLIHWLVKEGVSAIGLAGVSLGGWVTGMTVCVERTLRCAALTTPVVHMERAFAELAFCEPIRRNLADVSVDFGLMNLVNHRPQIPPRNILLVQSKHDLLAPSQTIEELWEAWDHPEIWRLPHGHISVLLSVPVMRRTLRWLTNQVTKVCAD